MLRTEPVNIMFVGAYPPSSLPCANHNRNTVRSLAGGGRMIPKVCAVCPQPRYDFDDVVVDQFKQNSRFAHIGAAQRMNESHADLMVLSYEQSVFGGQYGEYLLDLLERLERPYVVDCHHATLHPHPEQKQVLSDVCYYSAGVVVPGQYAAKVLAEVYEVPAGKLHVVPHGVPQSPTEEREALKASAGLSGQFVASSFGYICPSKGLEHAIRAVAELRHEYPNIAYLVVGEGRPGGKRERDENYRAGLKALAAELGVERQVRFAGLPANTSDLLNCLAMSDVYLTPYLYEDAGVSHTLGCAIGRGRVVISTPFHYAREMLSEGCGLLARFGDAHSIANCLVSLIESPGMKRQMEHNCRRRAQELAWHKTVRKYEKVLAHAWQKHHPESIM